MVAVTLSAELCVNVVDISLAVTAGLFITILTVLPEVLVLPVVELVATVVVVITSGRNGLAAKMVIKSKFGKLWQSCILRLKKVLWHHTFIIKPETLVLTLTITVEGEGHGVLV